VNGQIGPVGVLPGKGEEMSFLIQSINFAWSWVCSLSSKRLCATHEVYKPFAAVGKDDPSNPVSSLRILLGERASGLRRFCAPGEVPKAPTRYLLLLCSSPSSLQASRDSGSASHQREREAQINDPEVTEPSSEVQHGKSRDVIVLLYGRCRC
jgi:hypothetical protein